MDIIIQLHVESKGFCHSEILNNFVKGPTKVGVTLPSREEGNNVKFPKWRAFPSYLEF
jgi:hypothetical protein